MDRLRDAIASTKGRAVAIALLLLGMVTAVPAFASSASAHQSNISASVSCDGAVSWTTSSWSKSDEGSNGDVRVWTETDLGESHDLEHGSFNGDNGYQFSGTFAWPDTVSSMTLHSSPSGSWGNGESPDHGDDVSLDKPDDCEHHPEVDKDVECEDSAPGYGDGAVTLTLSNVAGPFGHDADFEISGPDDGPSSSHHVPSGHDEQVSYHGLSDGHHSVHVKVGDEEYDDDFEVDCDQSVPSVEQSQACVAGDGSITVNMSNTGGEEVEFTVEDPVTGEVEHITLQPDQSESRTFAGLDDGHYRVPVHAGENDLSKDFVVDCDHEDDGDHPDDECPSVDDGYGVSTVSTVSTGHDSTGHDSDGHDSDGHDGDGHDGDGHDCVEDDGGDGAVEVAEACVAHDGQVTVTLIVVTGEQPLLFTVEGVSYSVRPGSPKDVVIGGLADGPHRISVTAGEQDLSFDVTVTCDLPPRVTVADECVAFDGAVHLLLENQGDDASAVFAIDGVDHVVAAGKSETVVVDGLPDGTATIGLAINGVEQDDIVVDVDCDPVFDVTAECNTISSQGDVQMYWFTITNTESTPIAVTWTGGSAVVPAGESRTVATTVPVISLVHDGVEIASAQATNVVCSRTVTVHKDVVGTPVSPETYTVTISRVVGTTSTPEVIVDLVAGQTKTIALPSTLDPAGIVYDVKETGKGTAASSVVAPGTLTLSGHLGQTVSVVVTNGYAESLVPVPPPGSAVTTTPTTTPGATTTTVVQVLPPPPVTPTTTTPTTTPATTPTTTGNGPLPVSGGTPLPTLLIGLGMACLGGAMLLVRRPANR